MNLEHTHSVRVGPRLVALRWEPLDDDAGQFRDGTPPVIVVDESLRGHPHAAPIFLHELLHAVDEQYGIGLGERRIRSLESALTAFCQDNPAAALGWVRSAIRLV